MKALLLAAGRGTRLRPITDRTPKCLLEVGGTPMIDRWLNALERANVDEVLINVHYLAELVQDHLTRWATRLTVRVVFEPELLGSAGTIRANRDWIEDDQMFLACNADNLTDFDLALLVDQHQKGRTSATIAVFPSEKPSTCGVVEIDPFGLMIGFEEKPMQPKGNLASAGIYAFDSSVVEEIVGPIPQDIGRDLMPQLLGRTQTVLIDGYFRDIGTPKAYRMAQIEWGARAKR